MDYNIISYVIYGVLVLLSIGVACLVDFVKSKVSKKTLDEAEKYRKAIVDAITEAEKMFPGDEQGAKKKVIATLSVKNAVSDFKKFEVKDEQISKDIDDAVSVTKTVNAPDGKSGNVSGTFTRKAS